MTSGVWDLIAGAFLVGIIYMLVRPGSPATQAVEDVSNVLTSLIATATGVTVGNTPNPGQFDKLGTTAHPA